jgi:hypothetical protein
VADVAVQLEDLTPGAQVTGLLGSGPQPVTVIASTWIGGNAIRLAYRTGDNKLGERILYRHDEPGLGLLEQGPAYGFQSNPRLFKLAAEALRIRMAGRFDPMLAVHTSDLEPLPHQIQAVYGEMIPRTPLRYLLADDPGAGKTIMAGLYIKELMLRGDLERCLIVAPGGLVEQWQDELREKFSLDFDLLTRDLVQADPDGNPFRRHKLLIARMDQLSRSDELKAHLQKADFDLVVVDEAHRLEHGKIAPVDLAQAAIGPGMAVFSRYAQVIEPDGSRMRVRTALSLINQALGEILSQIEGDVSPDTRFCVEWFKQYGFDDGPYGKADVLARGVDTSVAGLERAGVVRSRQGKVRLLSPEDLPFQYDPSTDDRPSEWEICLHLTRQLSERGVKDAARGLRPLVDSVMSATAPAGRDWVEHYQARQAGRSGGLTYSANDPRFLLRIITENSRSFNAQLSKAQQSFASELRESANKWAHNEPFGAEDTWRALDTMERLLTAS